MGTFGFGTGLCYYIFGVLVLLALTAHSDYDPSKRLTHDDITSALAYAFFWPLIVVLMAWKAVKDDYDERKFLAEEARQKARLTPRDQNRTP